MSIDCLIRKELLSRLEELGHCRRIAGEVLMKSVKWLERFYQLYTRSAHFNPGSSDLHFPDGASGKNSEMREVIEY